MKTIEALVIERADDLRRAKVGFFAAPEFLFSMCTFVFALPIIKLVSAENLILYFFSFPAFLTADVISLNFLPIFTKSPLHASRAVPT